MQSYKAQLNFKTDSKIRSKFKHACELSDSNMEIVLNNFIDYAILNNDFLQQFIDKSEPSN